MTLEDDLRAALHDRADGIEPAGDGLDRIQARLAPPAAAATRPRLAPRLVAAAAVVLVAGTVAALTFRSDGTGNLEAAVSSSTTDPVAAAAVENELAPRPDTEEAETAPNAAGSSLVEGTTQFEDIPAAPPGILGPRSITPQAAAESFLGLIQRSGEDVTIERQGNLALVTRVAENGEMVPVTTLELGSVELADGTKGFVVVGARSPRMQIEQPVAQTINSGSTLVVAGEGEGFEGVVSVQLYSSRDGVLLNHAFPAAGNFGQRAPFSSSLAVSGPGPAWVVAQSTGGTDTRLEPFSAVPIVIEASRLDPEYIVTNIPADDPDGGLVVRSLPGTDGDVLAVLPAGQRSINKRASLSAFLGDGEPSYGLEPIESGQQEWWNIWLPEPLDDGRQWGWVNSNFLTTDAEIADADLLEIGVVFEQGLRGDDDAFAGLPWSETVVFGLASDLRETTGDKAGNPAFWQETFSFTPPPAFTGTLDGTLRTVLSPTNALLGADAPVEVSTVPMSAMSPYPLVNEQLAEQFPGASVVRLTDPNNDGSGWRLVTLFVQDGDTGREIVGMVGIDWTP